MISNLIFREETMNVNKPIICNKIVGKQYYFNIYESMAMIFPAYEIEIIG